jgi:phosphate transport system substrate-binding protein
VKNGTMLAQKAKLVPLPTRAYEISATHIKENKVGTVFKGENKVGIKVEDLLKLETTL